MDITDKKDTILVDIDGTLANCEHRRTFLAGDRPDWRSFNESMREDTLNYWCARLIAAMRERCAVILMSGRGEEYRDVTRDWLAKHDVEYDHLFMRGVKDYRRDSIVKRELFDVHVANAFNVLFVVDDRKQVVTMWREIGLVCLQCEDGDY